jgi:hypothetical protein
MTCRDPNLWRGLPLRRLEDCSHPHHQRLSKKGQNHHQYQYPHTSLLCLPFTADLIFNLSSFSPYSTHALFFIFQDVLNNILFTIYLLCSWASWRKEWPISPESSWEKVMSVFISTAHYITFCTHSQSNPIQSYPTQFVSILSYHSRPYRYNAVTQSLIYTPIYPITFHVLDSSCLDLIWYSAPSIHIFIATLPPHIPIPLM